MQYELNLRDYIRIFYKRKLLIIGTFIVVILAAFVNLSNQPYIYEASATIKIEERKNIAGLLTEWIVYNPQDVMKSSMHDVRGFPVMSKAAYRLGLVNEQTPVDEARGIISGLQGSVDTSVIEDTNIIEITATDRDPKKVMDLVNAVAQSYVEQNLEDRNRQARNARQFISDQLTQVEERLMQAEEQLRGFGDSMSQFRLSEPIQQKIIDLQFERTALLQKFTEKHPKVIQLEDQIKELESQFTGFSKEELDYNRLLREIEVNKKLYMMLKEKLEEARINEAQKVSDATLVDPAVFPTDPVSPNKQAGMMIGALLGLVLGISVAFLFETIDPSIGTIEDVENVIKLPVLGVVPSIRSEMDEMESKHWRQRFFPLLFPVKPNKAQDYLVRLFVHHKPNSLVAEAFRNIQANLKITGESRGKVLLVSSSGPGEGKTTCLINLALTCAQSGLKTLIISSDLRRPTVAKSFGLKRDPGLTEYLEGIVELSSVVRNVSDMVLGDLAFDEVLKFPGIENIFVLTSGQLPSNPVALLNSSRLSEMVKYAKQGYDLVFLDSPPVLPIADASIMAPIVDGVILVYEIGKTAREALMRCKMQLSSAGGKIQGVILNNIRPRTESIMFSYPYYYKYKYRETSSEKRDQGRDPAAGPRVT